MNPTPVPGVTPALVWLVAAGWAAAVGVWGWRRRPAPARLRNLASSTAGRGPQGLPGAGPAGRPRVGAAAAAARLAGRAAQAVGAAVLRRLHRPPDPALARRLGTAIVFGAAFLPVLAAAAVPAGVLAWALPAARARRRERRRLAALAGDLPDVVDLLVLAVGSGLTVNLAVRHVARRAPGPLGAELRRVCYEATLGRRLGDALGDLPARAGDAVRPLVAALVASERYGAPLGAGLERLALEVRGDRRRRAEEAARKVPVKLLFPLVTCTLPAFALLTVAPLIASAIRSLRL
jgi:tight adherence protein C